ncbi:UDP-3-O-acyl-N-acetylglucosamine deacetylase [Geobacter sp. DSM 9736]|uniref:UDP-3-O-acyl-N-acetylglucosamine deacetylase n=1 Tax=Geobacter sp. DSM 9736 TaxID=1277350 RepID=UPI000B50D335|nr:UDP-3-O-acyl-N-acetylglucosamine deacetylase [Geobacter sp. DSM 9736]SNB46783.1 UDP-3-O-[3-hydroxymyristoyl] N-acetylglucosamine deacetylase [Geobacter sp. DSM 9736]
MPSQRTLRTTVRFEGHGLHSGCKTRLVLKPAPPESGIFFRRVDLSPFVSIPATADYVVNTRFSTTVAAGGCAVSCIEHLMAALYATGLDNVTAEVDGPELPVMDGSSLPYVLGILRAGTVLLSAPRKYLVVTRPLLVAAERARISIHPAPFLRISYTMRFRHPAVTTLFRCYDSRRENFFTEYVPARTFGFLAEVEALRSQGLLAGGSLENALVFGDEGVVGGMKMRYGDEPVRHKMLDLAGDLFLAGCRVMGHIRAYRSGHHLNCRLVRQMLARTDCRMFTEQPEGESLPDPGSGLGAAAIFK